VIEITAGGASHHSDEAYLVLERKQKKRKEQVTMSQASVATFVDRERAASTMRALVFRGPNQIGLETVPVPRAGIGEAVIRITLTTICGTDLHILKGEYPVKPGLIIGHEPVGVIHELGDGVTGYKVGDRVLVGAITPCGQCNFCLGGNWSQCGGAIGGWKFGNTIHGAQAEYLLVPNAQANLAKIPDELNDEQVVLLADIASTGISAVESAEVKIGDTVAVFAQGPIGLCATAGAKLKGASLIIGVESDPIRAEMSKRMGADIVLDFTKGDVVSEIKGLTGGRGVDVSIEALGTQPTFENSLRVLRPGGTLSSLGVYSGKLSVPLKPFAAGLGDHKIVTTLCPGGKERMRRLIEMVRHGRLDLTPLLTHTFSLEHITDAYRVFGERQSGVIKVAVRP
jgi:2-desacetyl-2-hydroxyethyl bacteriochlorophyllide A dehydrogenase